MGAQKKSWGTFSAAEKTATIAGGIVQLALLVAAQADLWRRPAAQVRGGRRWAWALICLINFVGPISYFVFGRLPAERTPVEEAA